VGEVGDSHFEVTIDERRTNSWTSEASVEILTQNNGWAIVWMHDKYFVRHIKPEGCGTFLRGNATVGCTCKGKNKAAPIKVDDVILAKFRLLTLREKMK
jgi:hypothetical protein